MAARPAYFQRLLKFLRRKGRSHEDSEDLIQEAMLRLHVYRKEAPVRHEEAFLRQAVHNLSVDQHRRERQDLRREVSIEVADIQTPLVSPEVTPEASLEAEQRLRYIRDVLDAASTRTRQIYFAHRAGYSYDEISKHMGISKITIKRHIARALLIITEQGECD